MEIACDNTEPSHPNCWTQTWSRSKKSYGFACKINDYIWFSIFGIEKKEKFFLVIKKNIYFSGNKHFGLFQKILNVLWERINIGYLFYLNSHLAKCWTQTWLRSKKSYDSTCNIRVIYITIFRLFLKIMLWFILEDGNIYIRFNPIYQNILKYHVRKECYGKIFLKNLFDIN